MPTAIGTITDQDVLAALANDDALANAIDSSYSALGSAVPPDTLHSWKSALTEYQTFAKQSRSSASGGFFGGAWFGVPDMYQSALSWKQRLQTFQNDAQKQADNAHALALHELGLAHSPTGPGPVLPAGPGGLAPPPLPKAGPGGGDPGKPGFSLSSIPWYAWAGVGLVVLGIGGAVLMPAVAPLMIARRTL